MVVANPIDWTAKYAALYSWAAGASGWVTRWADQPDPRPDYPYVLLDVTATTKEGGLDEQTRTVDLTRARDIRITPTVQNNATYQVTINGNLAQYISDADATAAEITAGLKLAIDGLSQPVVVTDNGDTVDVEGSPESLNPTAPQLFNVTVTTNLTRENLDTGNEVEIRVTGSRELTVNVQAFERNTATTNAATDPSRNAYNMLTRLQASLNLPSVLTSLRAADLSLIEEGLITDLSELVEDTIISRASMDVRMRTLSVLTEYSGYIADVSGDAALDGSKGSPITEPYGVTT